MKQLLYITCNSKPEDLSASKTVGREFVNAFLENNKDFELKEIDLYEKKLPRLKYEYFESRDTVVSAKAYEKLSSDEKKDVDKIKELAKEFKEADAYCIAAPMWNLMYPSVLQEYMDCIIQNDITIKISPNKVEGLLDDKKRMLVYVQSSGGPIPWLLEGKMNHGGNYLRDIFKFMGIKDFYEILVDKTGYTDKEQHKAVEKGKKDARSLVKKLS